MYHEGGRVDTDTSEMAAARAQISAIQRQHRVQRRHGEEPPQTPTMSGLLRHQQPAGIEDSAHPSAQPRESSVRDDDDGSQVSQPQLPRLGRPVQHSPPSRSSSQSRSRARGRPRLARDDSDTQSRGSRGRPPLTRNPVGRPSRAGSEAPLRNFDEPGPRFSGDDQEAPLSLEDVTIKRAFDEAVAAEEMRRCSRCKERWFDIKLKAVLARWLASRSSSWSMILNYWWTHRARRLPPKLAASTCRHEPPDAPCKICVAESLPQDRRPHAGPRNAPSQSSETARQTSQCAAEVKTAEHTAALHYTMAGTTKQVRDSSVYHLKNLHYKVSTKLSTGPPLQ
jgi:hypothetical protein